MNLDQQKFSPTTQQNALSLSCCGRPGDTYGDGLSRIVNAYDAFGRLTSETTITNQPGIVVPGSKYSYTYEEFTPLTRTIATAPAGQSTGFTDVAISTYALDDVGRVVGVNQSFTGPTTNWKSGQLPDSIIASATFNLDGQVGQVIRKNAANAPMFQSDYQYSLKGELEKVTHTGAGGSTIGRAVASHEILRTQDGRAQNASASVHGNNGQPLATASGQYNYDSYGNPSSVTPAAGNEDLNLIPGFKPQTNTGQTEGSHSRSAQNRELGNSDHLFRYDNEGRLVYERRLGQLTTTQDSSTQQIFETDYVYDLTGRLRTRTETELSKSVSPGGVTTNVVSSTTMYFAYDAAGRLLEELQLVDGVRKGFGYIGGGNNPDLIYELSGASALISTAQTMLPGVAGTIAVSGNAGSMETLWTLPDTAGSTRTYAALNETGNSILIRHQHFDGQGVLTTVHTDGTLPADTSLPIQFAGNLYHAFTGDYVISDGTWYDSEAGNRLTPTATHLGTDNYAQATAYPSKRVGASFEFGSASNWVRAGGILRATGGAAEIAVGKTLIVGGLVSFGFLAIPGAILVGHGADQFATGVGESISGIGQQSQGVALAQRLLGDGVAGSIAGLVYDVGPSLFAINPYGASRFAVGLAPLSRSTKVNAYLAITLEQANTLNLGRTNVLTANAITRATTLDELPRPFLIKYKNAVSEYSVAPKGLLGREGISYELKHLNKHLPDTAESARLIRKDGSAHVFKDKATLSRVEQELLENGESLGTVRGWERYGKHFDEPIGYRIDAQGNKIPLHYGELKLNPKTGLYHIIPRTRPAS